MVRTTLWRGQPLRSLHHNGFPSPGRILGVAWSAYSYALATKPMATQALTAAVGFSLGDASAQILGGPHKPRLRRGRQRVHDGNRYHHNWRRTARTAAFGGLIAGPMGHMWFTFLERVVLPSAPRSLPAVGVKMALDQLLMAPFGCAVYFTCMDIMMGHPNHVSTTLRTKFRKTLMASYKMWPAANVVNFALVPPQYRVLYTNLLSVVWTCILSKTSAAGEVVPAFTVAVSGVAVQAIPEDDGGRRGSSAVRGASDGTPDCDAGGCAGSHL